MCIKRTLGSWTNFFNRQNKTMDSNNLGENMVRITRKANKWTKKTTSTNQDLGIVNHSKSRSTCKHIPTNPLPIILFLKVVSKNTCIYPWTSQPLSPTPKKKKPHDFTIYLNPYSVINVKVMTSLEPYILSWLSHTFNPIVADHEVKHLFFTSTCIVP